MLCDGRKAGDRLSLDRFPPTPHASRVIDYLSRLVPLKALAFSLEGASDSHYQSTPRERSGAILPRPFSRSLGIATIRTSGVTKV